jgi:hypothetical protein
MIQGGCQEVFFVIDDHISHSIFLSFWVAVSGGRLKIWMN